MSSTYVIPASSAAKLLDRVKTMKRKHLRSGLPMPSVTILETFDDHVQLRDPMSVIRGNPSGVRSLTVKLARVEVDGFSAKVGDWNLIGYRSAINDRIVETGTMPLVHDPAALCCSHCETDRKRKSSYVFSKSDAIGPAVEIGSTCAAAFLGASANEAALSAMSSSASFLAALEVLASPPYAFSEDDVLEEAETVLAAANLIVARDGYVSARDARQNGTEATWRTVVRELSSYRSTGETSGLDAMDLDDYASADAIAEWCRAENAADQRRDTYFSKVVRVLENGLQEIRDVAILTSACETYRRQLATTAAKERMSDFVSGSDHVGLVGDKGYKVVSVVSIRPFQGRYGKGSVHTMIDSSANILVWFSSSADSDFEPGQSYEIQATVKSHDTCPSGRFEGARQTVLTRVAKISDLGPATFPWDEAVEPELPRSSGSSSWKL